MIQASFCDVTVTEDGTVRKGMELLDFPPLDNILTRPRTRIITPYGVGFHEALGLVRVRSFTDKPKWLWMPDLKFVEAPEFGGPASVRSPRSNVPKELRHVTQYLEHIGQVRRDPYTSHGFSGGVEWSVTEGLCRRPQATFPYTRAAMMGSHPFNWPVGTWGKFYDIRAGDAIHEGLGIFTLKKGGTVIRPSMSKFLYKSSRLPEWYQQPEPLMKILEKLGLLAEK